MSIRIRALWAAIVLALGLGGAVSAVRADTGACAVANGGSLPDLIVDSAALSAFLSVTEEKFSPGSCAVQEGFVSMPGWHTLLRFNTSTPNIGLGALVIGDPAQCGSLYEMSTCHGHLHFREYADYRLWTLGGYQTWVARRMLSEPTNTGVNAAVLAELTRNRHLLMGRKMGFCMIDSVQYSGSATQTFQSCTLNQGLSAGWSDRYRSDLDGQYIDLENLKEGLYVLEVHVNAEHLLPESDYTNNSAAVQVLYIPRRGSNPGTIQVQP